ncbi:hypothetical protein HPB52_002748 [Rhipicephalus sanguineus]|uniref:Uncharacterized protein n=1 Tax=Rhipicephalus sanguineus TaxID=34632 RepID=A0A9D4Q9H6_RHISA|nr:hypothetical protein HPB52_002748 [Rhipicephalus sanguineus]
MAQHAMAAMPCHALPGFVAASPFTPGTNNNTGTGMLAASHNNSGDFNGRANTPNPDTPGQSQMLTVLQESIRALTSAMEMISPHPARRFPNNPSRNARGQVICFRCHQAGHIRHEDDPDDEEFFDALDRIPEDATMPALRPRRSVVPHQRDDFVYY